jgi:hypothetical protein
MRHSKALNAICRALEAAGATVWPSGDGHPPPCVWREDADSLWNTACGRTWQFFDEGPGENRVNFCHGCGHPVQSVGYVEPIDDDDEDGRTP